jgi:adenylate cyclase
MSESEPLGRSYRVGDLLVDMGRGRVTRQAEVVPLTKLSFELLIALIEVAPNLLTPDLMMQRVWPGVVVSPETVTQRVKVLRDALGDDPRQPRYIEGVRGRGYRLVARVVPTDVAGVVSPESVSPKWPYTRALLILIGVITAVLAVYRLEGARFGKQVVIERKAVMVSSAPPASIAVLPFQNLSTAAHGGIVALGMSEAVLHQLANLHQLTVIARTSSFAFQGRNEDVREIGRRLNCHYLLEGSVQSDPVRLRVTAQLVDATTGGHVWSIQLDRNPRDIFAIQDEIAQAVTQALQLSLKAQADAGANAHRTRSIEAWLAFQQGRALLATRKISDLETAKERFAEAIRWDPNFAEAYIGKAEAYVSEGFVPQSEFWLGTYATLSAADKEEVARLLGRALALDPHNGGAYLVRAWQEEDDDKAEPDYRRGLQLSPNNASGYAHFARLLFRARGKGSDSFDPAKREEALRMMDRARELDPLAPGHYLLKALMLDYGRSDWKQAVTLSVQALEEDPNFYPALMKLAEFKWAGSGELAEAARYAEQALAMEPQALWLRHMLSRIYLDLGDFDAARSVIEARHKPDAVGQILLEMYRHNWKRVRQLSLRADFSIPGDYEFMEIATVHSALTAGAPGDALKFIDEDVGLKWGPDGEPAFTVPDFGKEGRVLLARSLIALGEVERGRRVLRAALREMDHEAFDLGRGDMWFSSSRAEALAVLGDSEGAIEALRRSCAASFLYDLWYRLDAEPAYSGLREDARFKALTMAQHSHIEHERELLNTMRAEGLVPMRSPAAPQ